MEAITADYPAIPLRRERSEATLAFTALPIAAQLYVIVAAAAGVSLFLLRTPRIDGHMAPMLMLVGISILMAAFKVTLPLSKGDATMTLSYAPDLACLFLVGPNEAMALATASVWCQCTFRSRHPTPLYQTVFSMASIAITLQAVGVVFHGFGGVPANVEISTIAVPALAATITYFAVNTWLVATAIALATRASVARAWHDNFLWSAPSYFLAAGVAVPAAAAFQQGSYWAVPLGFVPLYLTYRSYRVYLGRVEDEQRHARELAQEKAQLAFEKERLGVTLRNIRDGVITTDVNGRIVLMNAAAEALLGVSQQDSASKLLATVLAEARFNPVPACADVIRDVLQTGSDHRLIEQCTRARADGETNTIEGGGTAIRDRDGNVVGSVWVLRDVTGMIRLEEERAKASKLESLGLLAGGLAHDFNNILTGVAGNISLVRSSGTLDPDIGSRLAEAERACARAKGLTNQLLTFSKGGAPVKKTTSIAAIVQECATFALRGSAVAARFHTSSTVCAADVDAGQISQVVENLVINAQHAMPTGGAIDIHVENQDIAVDEHCHGVRIPAGRYVSISIRDYGVGIPPVHLTRIFDPYFTTKPKGSGLGLATCYSIVQRHGGFITVHSVVGSGSCFRVYLPASNRAVEERPVAAVTSSVVMGGRVLIMDDEEPIRDVASRMFKRLGYDVVTTCDGSEAVDRFSEASQERRPFDLVVLDLTVPAGIGGREAVSRLKELDPDVNVLVSSGYADDPVMANYSAYGFCGTLPKPFVLGDIRQALQRIHSQT